MSENGAEKQREEMACLLSHRMFLLFFGVCVPVLLGGYTVLQTYNGGGLSGLVGVVGFFIGGFAFSELNHQSERLKEIICMEKTIKEHHDTQLIEEVAEAMGVPLPTGVGRLSAVPPCGRKECGMPMKPHILQEEMIRLNCNGCGKYVSTPVPADTIIRAWIECPECVERQEEEE